MTAGLQEVDVYSDKEYFCRPQQFPAAPPQKPRRLVALTPQPQKPRISLPQQLRAAPATYIYTRIPALAAVTFQWSPQLTPQLSPRLVRSGHQEHHPPHANFEAVWLGAPNLATATRPAPSQRVLGHPWHRDEPRRDPAFIGCQEPAARPTTMRAAAAHHSGGGQSPAARVAALRSIHSFVPAVTNAARHSDFLHLWKVWSSHL